MNVLVVLCALSAVIIFGASPVAAKFSLAGLPAIDVALLRTLIGGLIALPIVLLLKMQLPKNREQRILLLISGFCGFIGFPLLFTFGLAYTSANHGSMILAALPIFTSAVAMTWDKQKPKWIWLAGCSIALFGEYLIISNTQTTAGEASIFGDILVVLSNVLASIGYVAGGRLKQTGYSGMGTTLWGVIIFAIVLIPFSFIVLEVDSLSSVAWDIWLAVFYLATMVTIVGYALWYWALGNGGIAKVSLFQFLQPTSGVILAWWLLGEQLSIGFIAASCIVLLGVWIAVKAK